MKIYRLEYFSQKISTPPLALTIGNFDGFHLGHQALLAELRNSQVGELAVMTFDPHPVKVLKDKNFLRIFSLKTQEEFAHKYGVQHFIRVNFDESFSDLTVTQFITDFLESKFNIASLVVGYDFKFGKNRGGGAEDLAEWAHKKSIPFKRIEPIRISNEIVSSTSIRKLLDLGQVKEVGVQLGRNYEISGEVEHGEGRGKKLGFPTINVHTAGEVLPKNGVYLSLINYRETLYPSVTNIGSKPTFHVDGPREIESHILNFSRNMYGEYVGVQLLDYIRPETKFSNASQLMDQIQKDILIAKKAHGI